MEIKLLYIPNHDKQNFPFCRLNIIKRFFLPKFNVYQMQNCINVVFVSLYITTTSMFMQFKEGVVAQNAFKLEYSEPHIFSINGLNGAYMYLTEF